MRTILTASLLVALTQANLFKHFKKTNTKSVVVDQPKQLADGEWPAVHVLENFELQASMYTWDAQAKQLVTYLSMSMYEQLDTKGNRAFTDMVSDIQGIGKGIHVQTFVDYGFNTVIQKIPDLAICNRYD